MTQLKGKFGRQWQSEMSRHLKEDSLTRIETRGAISGQQFMEETYLPDILTQTGSCSNHFLRVAIALRRSSAMLSPLERWPITESTQSFSMT
jgi:hypothetical protein